MILSFFYCYRLNSNEFDVPNTNQINTSRQGMCVICEEKDLIEKSIEEISQKQRETIQKKRLNIVKFV